MVLRRPTAAGAELGGRFDCVSRWLCIQLLCSKLRRTTSAGTCINWPCYSSPCWELAARPHMSLSCNGLAPSPHRREHARLTSPGGPSCNSAACTIPCTMLSTLSRTCLAHVHSCAEAHQSWKSQLLCWLRVYTPLACCLLPVRTSYACWIDTKRRSASCVWLTSG